MRPDTEVREHILAVIEASVIERGFPPTVREIGAAVGLASPSTTHQHLKRLEKDGRIEVMRGASRTLRIVR